MKTLYAIGTYYVDEKYVYSYATSQKCEYNILGFTTKNFSHHSSNRGFCKDAHIFPENRVYPYIQDRLITKNNKDSTWGLKKKPNMFGVCIYHLDENLKIRNIQKYDDMTFLTPPFRLCTSFYCDFYYYSPYVSMMIQNTLTIREDKL